MPTPDHSQLSTPCTRPPRKERPPVKIDGVPDHVTHAQVADLLAELGLEPKRTRWVLIERETMVIEVLALNKDGQPFRRNDEAATYSLTIPIVD